MKNVKIQKEEFKKPNEDIVQNKNKQPEEYILINKDATNAINNVNRSKSIAIPNKKGKDKDCSIY